MSGFKNEAANFNANKMSQVNRADHAASSICYSNTSGQNMGVGQSDKSKTQTTNKTKTAQTESRQKSGADKMGNKVSSKAARR